MIPQQSVTKFTEKKSTFAKLVLAALLGLQFFRLRSTSSPKVDEERFDCGGLGERRCAEAQLFHTWQKTTVFADMDVVPLIDSWESLNASANNLSFGLSFLNGLAPERLSAEITVGGDVVTQAPKHEASEELHLLHFNNGSGMEQGEGLLRQRHSADDRDAHELLRHDGIQSAVRPSDVDRAALYAEFDRQAEKITKSLASSGELTPWGRQLEESQHDMESRMAALPSHKKKETQVVASKLAPAQSTLLEEINDLLREMCEDVRHRDSEACKPLLSAFASAHVPVKMASAEERRRELDEELKALADDHAAWQRNFDDKVTATHRELCEDPMRRSRPDCIKFLASIAKVEGGKHRELHDAHQASLSVLRSDVKQEIKERAATLERKLSEIVSERKAWEKELLQKYGLGEQTGAHLRGRHAHEEVPAASQDDQMLHWSAVESWALNNRLRGSLQRHNNRTVLHRHDLLGAKWAGRIPKVACITAFKSGPYARIELQYLIENFRRQRYEGTSQLILVYHSKDVEAAKLAALHADGSYIKAVASQSEEQAFPSTTDLRYGAWVARGADVIAHWAFESWHRRDRLSLQVRAMGYSARPACVLTRNDTVATGVNLADETLIGEAAWMNQHWHPWLQEHAAVLHSAQAYQIVELDASDELHHE